MDAVVFVHLAVSGDEFLFTQSSETVELDAIPSIDSVSVSPAKLDPGRSIGQRETVTVRFSDHQYVFDTESYDAGTFWTKFRARYAAIQGSALKVYRGERGQALADMERRTYVVDSLQISSRGAAITAKDPLALVLGRAAQAPAVSTGELTSAIDADDTSITLTPSGVGNLEYPESGRGCIGGSEIASFTRSADVVTLTSRGENIDGVGEEHEAGSKFQLVLEYVDATPSEIVNDLLTNYTDVDPAWVTVSDWTAVDDHVGHLYSAQIPAPESVTKLLDELSEQIGITLYWDSVAEQLRLISLAPAGSSYVLTADNMMADEFDISEQPDKRISQPWIYYAQRNAAKKVDEADNYRRVVVEVADNQGDFEQVAIKKIFSRWIQLDSQVAATRLGEMLVARYKVPPRTFKFDLFRSGGADLPRLGSGITLNHWELVDEDGAEVSVAAQIISESGAEDHVSYEAEEMTYDGSTETSKFVVIDSDAVAINLRTVFNAGYSSVGASDTVTFTIQTGVNVTGYGFFVYAVTVGTWPAGVTLNLVINGTIISPKLAIDTGRAINIENNGTISGNPGASGIAINGYSFVTYSGSGALLGSLVG